MFENRLKPETKDAVQGLHNASIRMAMITGDNALTASNISFKCKIADLTKKMYIYDYRNHELICEDFKYNPAEEPIDQF